MRVKTCSACGIEKEIGEFPLHWNNQRQKHYPRAKCNPCHREYKRQRYESRDGEVQRAAKARRYATPEGRAKILDQQHKSRYGITHAERDALLAAQGGGCAICGVTEPPGRGWCTDHDRSCCPGDGSCGECIRGVLCCNCNCAIGQFFDDVERISSAIRYINSTQRKQHVGTQRAAGR